MWNDEERPKSFTWRELAAIYFALQSFCPLLKNSSVKWFTDNQAAARIVESGSMRKDLHFLCLKVFQTCLLHKISLEIQWIPRSEVQRADYISRLIDTDDWQISTQFLSFLKNFRDLTHLIVSQIIATQLPKFYSRFWNPGCAGVDYFVQPISNENCLVVPPVFLISRALQYMFSQEALATVIVPFWPSASFWPFICRVYAHFVTSYRLYSGSSVLQHGRKINSLLGSKTFTGTVLAIRFCFRGCNLRGTGLVNSEELD